MSTSRQKLIALALQETEEHMKSEMDYLQSLLRDSTFGEVTGRLLSATTGVRYAAFKGPLDAGSYATLRQDPTSHTLTDVADFMGDLLLENPMHVAYWKAESGDMVPCAENDEGAHPYLAPGHGQAPLTPDEVLRVLSFYEEKGDANPTGSHPAHLAIKAFVQEVRAQPGPRTRRRKQKILKDPH